MDNFPISAWGPDGKSVVEIEGPIKPDILNDDLTRDELITCEFVPDNLLEKRNG
jgi:hypothetical protein